MCLLRPFPLAMPPQILQSKGQLELRPQRLLKLLLNKTKNTASTHPNPRSVSVPIPLTLQNQELILQHHLSPLVAMSHSSQ